MMHVNLYIDDQTFESVQVQLALNTICSGTSPLLP